MPKLNCKVSQCAHYMEGLCSKNYIDVDGPLANKKQETSCKSYLYKDIDTYEYEFATMDFTPTLQTEVYCDATQCVYEKNQRCYADRIEISNVSSKDHSVKKTNNTGVTHCKTFEPID